MFAALLFLVPAFLAEVMRPWPASPVRTLVPVDAVAASLPRGAQALGALPPGQPLHLIVGLAIQHPQRLAAFLQLRRQRNSALFGASLTPTQFADRFGVSAATQARLVAYLRGRGVQILRTYPDRVLIDVAGTAAQIMAAFHTRLVRYRDPGGYIHFGTSSRPLLPAALADSVSAIIGLQNTASPYHPASVHPASRASRRPRAIHPPTGLTNRRLATVHTTDEAPPAGLLTPAQLQSAYDVTRLYGLSSGSAAPGAGQTIALFELSPFDPADVAAYDAAFGLNATTPATVPVDGGPTEAFGATGRLEVALDVELLHAIAPSAQTLVYSGPGSPTGSDNTGADDVYARIVNDDKAQVLSTSWGQCEPDQQADSPPDTTLLHTLFAQAVAEGMTVVAATGDSGANDCTDGKPNPSVDYPASDPYVVAVGGTVLTMSAGTQVAGEIGWSGSGGGVSQIFPRPTWQAGPGLPASSMRQVPDVALNAGTGYVVRVSSSWQGAGGTSASVPVWAALLALANEARYAAAQAAGAPTPAPCAALRGLGDIHAALYQLGATPFPTPPLRDITAGDGNGVATPGPGWDAVTGWGVPDANALVQALIARPDLVAPTPVPCSGASPTMTATASASPTATTGLGAVATVSNTPSVSPTASATATATGTPTASPTASSTPSATATASSTATASPTASVTPTSTRTAPPATPGAQIQSHVLSLPGSQAEQSASPTSTVTGTATTGPMPRATKVATTHSPTPSRTPSRSVRAHPTATPAPTRIPGCNKQIKAGGCAQSAGSTSGRSANSSTKHSTSRSSSSTKTKTKTKTKAKPVSIPALQATIAIRTLRALAWAHVQVQFAPGVQMSLTLIARNQPRQHVYVSTDKHGRMAYTFRLARPAPHRYVTVQVRVWGVYAHHRRTKILKVKVFG